jgi:hypothetical protein
MLIKIVDEVKKSIDNECFMAALALVLTIPDICGKAEYPDAGISERYIKWYNMYVGKYEKPSDPYGEDMPYSSGEIIYNLRNSFLHQGTPNIDVTKVKEERCKVDKFILTISDVIDSGTSRVSYGLENKITERMLEINIVNLCSKLCRTAKSYYVENKDKFTFFKFELKDIRYTYSSLFCEKSQKELS